MFILLILCIHQTQQFVGKGYYSRQEKTRRFEDEQWLINFVKKIKLSMKRGRQILIGYIEYDKLKNRIKEEKYYYHVHNNKKGEDRLIGI